MAPATKRAKRAAADGEFGVGEDAVARAIYAHYMGAQGGGGAYPIFRGRPIQSGEGIGDIFRSIGRFLFPLLAPLAKSTASTFIRSTAGGLESGKSLGEAAKLGASAGLGEGVAGIGQYIQARREAARAAKEAKAAEKEANVVENGAVPQAGTGRRRKRRKGAKAGGRKRKHHQTGGRKGKRRGHRAYKSGKRRKPKHLLIHSDSNSINF